MVDLELGNKALNNFNNSDFNFIDDQENNADLNSFDQLSGILVLTS